jgi:hypothetical protein
LPVNNPWTKKSPLMSMWLSGANAAAGRARGYTAAQTNKQKALLTKQVARVWTGTWLAATKPKRNR